MPVRTLPPDLKVVLRRAADLERATVGLRQFRAVTRANSRLMLAAVNAGWMVSEVAVAMGLNRHAASKRIQHARRVFGSDDLAGLDVPPPPPRPIPVSPLAILHTPVETRDWLSAPEAMRLAGISFGTLTAWRRHGLLPNTRWLNRAQALYARSDLERVMAAPHTGRGIRVDAVLDQIAAAL